MDNQSCTNNKREEFTDRGLGQRLVLSATASSRKIAEDVKTHVVHTGCYLCMENKMLVMCVITHGEGANVK
jgi:hypothetical protein